MQENRQKPGSSKKKPLNDYGRYMSMATTMAVIIVGGTFLGRWLDKWMGNDKFPVFTLVLALFSVFVAMWIFIRDFIKKK